MKIYRAKKLICTLLVSVIFLSATATANAAVVSDDSIGEDVSTTENTTSQPEYTTETASETEYTSDTTTEATETTETESSEISGTESSDPTVPTEPTKPALPAYQGVAGDNLTYSFDTATGVLSFYGEGTSMYLYNANNRPAWYEFAQEIITVDMRKATKVKNIAGYSFADLFNLTTVYYPNSVKKIGAYSFSNTPSLMNFKLTKSVTNVNKGAFSGSGITGLTVPNKNTIIFDSADTVPERTVLTCFSKSPAYDYAKKYGRKYKYYVGKISLPTERVIVGKGISKKMPVEIKPASAVNKTIKWYTTDSKIATVDKNGNVKGVKRGTCYVYAKASDVGATISNKRMVTVSNFYKDCLAVDVSRWNGNVNYSGVKSSGVDAVIIQCGYGKVSSQKDIKFETNYKNAKKNGLQVGAYHYSYARNVLEAKKEADVCLKWIKGKTFDLPVYIDMEEDRYAYLGRKTLTSIAMAFCEKIEKAGYDAGVYANANWFRNFLDYKKIKAKYSIWLAQYAGSKDFDCDIWQYSDSGKLKKNSCWFDMNHIYGATVKLTKITKNISLYNKCYKDPVGKTSVKKLTLKAGAKIEWLDDDGTGWSKVMTDDGKVCFVANSALNKKGLSTYPKITLKKKTKVYKIAGDKLKKASYIGKGRKLTKICHIESGKYKGYSIASYNGAEYYIKA